LTNREDPAHERRTAPHPPLAAAALLAATTLGAQTTVVTRITVEPARITMQAGQTQAIKITAYDATGKVVPDAQFRTSGPRGALRVSEAGITALKAGSFTAVVSAFTGRGIEAVTVDVPVLVTNPALSKLDITAEQGALYVGTMLAHSAKGTHGDGSLRQDLRVTWRSSDRSLP
jgi:hypothetical protein